MAKSIVKVMLRLAGDVLAFASLPLKMRTRTHTIVMDIAVTQAENGAARFSLPP